METINETIDNGESIVQVATIGKITGSDLEGNSVEQNFTEEALKKIVDDSKGKEFLVDADHQSEKGESTEAKGWASELEYKEGKGLFAKIKWTDIGKKLIQNRVFRWLSPSWIINQLTGEPIEMTSIAITNRPSQIGRIEPIVNSEPVQFTDEGKDDLNIIKEINMTKDELKALIVETLKEIKAEEEKSEAVEEVKEEIKEEVTENTCVKNECGCDEKKDETVTENSCAEKEEVKNEEAPKAEEPKIEEEKKEEVIKIETLNSAPSIPTTATEPEWKKLHGQAFFDYLKKNNLH